MAKKTMASAISFAEAGRPSGACAAVAQEPACTCAPSEIIAFIRLAGGEVTAAAGQASNRIHRVDHPLRIFEGDHLREMRSFLLLKRLVRSPACAQRMAPGTTARAISSRDSGDPPPQHSQLERRSPTGNILGCAIRALDFCCGCEYDLFVPHRSHLQSPLIRFGDRPGDGLFRED